MTLYNDLTGEAYAGGEPWLNQPFDNNGNVKDALIERVWMPAYEALCFFAFDELGIEALYGYGVAHDIEGIEFDQDLTEEQEAALQKRFAELYNERAAALELRNFLPDPAINNCLFRYLIQEYGDIEATQTAGGVSDLVFKLYHIPATVPASYALISDFSEEEDEESYLIEGQRTARAMLDAFAKAKELELIRDGYFEIKRS